MSSGANNIPNPYIQAYGHLPCVTFSQAHQMITGKDASSFKYGNYEKHHVYAWIKEGLLVDVTGKYPLYAKTETGELFEIQNLRTERMVCTKSVLKFASQTKERRNQMGSKKIEVTYLLDDTKEIFKSIGAACTALGVTRFAISKSITEDEPLEIQPRPSTLEKMGSDNEDCCELVKFRKL